MTRDGQGYGYDAFGSSSASADEDHRDDWCDDPESQEGRRTGLRFLTFAELAAEVDAAGPRRWMLRGVWPAGDYGVHAAEMKAQKTWNTADLAVSVASGTPWLGSVQVDDPGTVLMFVGEGGRANTVRRIRAVGRERDIDPSELPIIVCDRAPKLNNDAHVAVMAAKIDELRPVLVTLDPLYLAAAGAKLGDLYSMGEMLEKPQIICQAVGASLWVVTHFNRSQGSGAGRITGAGPAEWGRVLVSGTVKSRRTEDDTLATTVVTELDIVGGEVPGRKMRLRRRIWADDPDDLDSPLYLSTSVSSADDDTPEQTGAGTAELGPADRKLLAALAVLDRPASISEMVDGVAAVHGHGLKRETCSRALNRMAKAGYVVVAGPGVGASNLWKLITLGGGSDAC